MDFPIALTYDDVLLVPQRSDIQSRKEVDTTGRVTRNIYLKVPIVAANMDSVTSPELAIAMALNGGLAILHRFMSIEEMCDEIQKVKRAQNVVIEDPYTVLASQTMHDALEILKEKGVSGLPVVDKSGRLQGMLTRRDLSAATTGDDLVEKWMTPREKIITGRADTDHYAAQEMMSSGRVEKLPLVDSEDHLIGMITMKDIVAKERFPHATKDENGRLRVGAAVGVRGDYIERAIACEKAGADLICLDIAHGHAEHAIEAIRELKKAVSIDILAGNVATYEGALDLIEAGADGIKAGVGPGSVCSTRRVAGVGYPQFDAIRNCARACVEHNVPLCADGGIRQPGDFSKAMAISDSVMIGGMFAGSDEAPGEVITKGSGGRRFKVHRGMASQGAADARKALDGPTVQREYGLNLGQDSGDVFNQTTPEGVEAVVPASGPIQKILAHLVGGLRSGMSYSNSRSIEEFHQRAQFVRITQAGLIESHPHDVEL